MTIIPNKNTRKIKYLQNICNCILFYGKMQSNDQL